MRFANKYRRVVKVGLCAALFWLVLYWPKTAPTFAGEREVPRATRVMGGGENDGHENERNRRGGGGVPGGGGPPVAFGATPPGGWGRDCSQWIRYSDPWVGGELCYDPLLGGGAGWRNCATQAHVVWPALNIELWIEMECVFHWDATHVEIHRASDYGDVVIELTGGSCCNNGHYIITTPPTVRPNLDVLPFQQDMLGRTGATYGTDIPLVWQYSLNGAGYQAMGDLRNDRPGQTSKYFLVPVCCNSWTVRIVADLKFHQEDGYYFLGGPGAFTCSANPL